jgi:hypothetical protein
MNEDKSKDILEKHLLWLYDQEGGKRADLRGATLISANLACADLRGADLRGANLPCVNLTRANLANANLACVNLTRANLANASLIHVNLRDANLRDANLREADLQWSNLTGADLRGTDLREADLQGTDLREADLQWSNLTGAYLACVNLTGVNLTGANVYNTTIKTILNIYRFDIYYTKKICQIGCLTKTWEEWENIIKSERELEILRKEFDNIDQFNEQLNWLKNELEKFMYMKPNQKV